MTQEEILNRLELADKAYYEDNNPIMTDAQYDALRKIYEKRYGDINKVSGNVSKSLMPFKHEHNINSLRKIKYNETEELDKEIRKLGNVVVEPKLDGLTIVVYGDKFVTRGNGTEGEIINYFPSRYLGNNKSQYPIRGEAFLTEENFLWINEQQKKKGLKLFANARNCASGILRRLDKSEYIEKINFLCYDVIGLDIAETKKLQYIKDNTCFDVVEYHSYNDLSKEYEYFKNQPYPIDGLVIKCDYDNSLQKFGSTVHHPNNAFAYKALDESKETVLLNIEWQVGKDKLTPVAIFNEIQLEGTAVNKASLSNYDNIQKMGLMIGDIIAVEKRNMIIPYVKHVVQHTDNSQPIICPTVCPICGSKIETNGAENFCSNDNCRGKLAQKIDYICDKKLLNIKGLSIATINKLIDNGKLNNVWDIFNVTYNDFLSLEGFADVSAKKLVDAIQQIKSVSLSIFIACCCVNGIGLEIGKLLQSKYNYNTLLAVLSNKEIDKLLSIKGIGDINANKLISDNFIRNFTMLKQYLDISESQQINGLGRKIAITGKFDNPRSYYQNIIEQNGDKLVNTISNDTYALVIADVNSTSSKAIKARKLGIKLLSDKDLLNLYK